MHPDFEAPLHDDENVTPGKRIVRDVRLPDVPVPQELDVRDNASSPQIRAEGLRTRFETPVERTPEEVAFRHMFHVARRDWERRLATLQKHADDEAYPIDPLELEDQMHADDALLTATLYEAYQANGSNAERVGAYQQGLLEQRARMHTVLRTARAMLNVRTARPDTKTAEIPFPTQRALNREDAADNAALKEARRRGVA